MRFDPKESYFDPKESYCDWEKAESIFNLYKMSDTGGNIQRITTNQTFEYCGDW